MARSKRKTKRSRRLGSTEAEHNARGSGHYEDAAQKLVLAKKAARNGICVSALSAFGSAARAIGRYEAETEGAGKPVAYMRNVHASELGAVRNAVQACFRRK